MDFISNLNTPLGVLSIRGSKHFIRQIMFEANEPDPIPCDLTELARVQLQEYFAGERLKFDFPLEQQGTSFQQLVWSELKNLQPGNPISYSALSMRMKNPLAIRAIAAANGKNKLMVVVPCHRVIGTKGNLVGYAAGLWRKKWLLEHEAKLTGSGQSALDLGR
ncbi:methylated-DNA--[protein]-cysteine S-methyltransferase [Pedobacter sp. SYSU D00535]|uniref:methylated-DNA--[protein]-cysteine S-methyltransferase n=1 Tax=Pedobacter sp. SYSU D00535 TaxID=2810308 RepID=UPI001A960C57|nr:methylated-DNA--[protein]-cysteine S-methyltransferase [Pedobacter sp. SYSU D00535]